MRVLENRTRDNRTLTIASGTMQEDDPLRPELATSATRATETGRPAKLHQIIAADFFSSEAALKLGLVARVILHGPSCYMLGLHESSA